MTQRSSTPKWIETIPTRLQILTKEYEDLANTALKNAHPYHSVRIINEDIMDAGDYAGRLLGWAISATTQVGWEYENTTSHDGYMWLTFKNPYVFS
jgi:hypothetical protein